MPKIQQHEALTDRSIRQQPPGATPIDLRDAAARGLILTVFPNGRRQFSVRYVFAGKHRRVTLGEYGRSGMTLAKARDAAGQMRTRILAGQDPAAERPAAKQKPTETVGALAEDFMTKYSTKFKRSHAEDQRILDRDILPFWKDKSVKELTRKDVRVLVERVAKRAPVMANNVLALVSKLLNFAVDGDWIDANPAARMKKPTPTPERDRVLTHDEIRKLWRCLSNLPATDQKPAPGRKRSAGKEDDPLCPVSRWLAAAFKMRLLSAQRGGEVCRMRWQDIDLETRWWTIPAEHSKNGEPHRVALTADAIDLICSLQPEKERGLYVFSRDGSAAAADRARKAGSALARVLGFDFRGHDLRRTAATNMAEAGITRPIISRVLNHVDAGPRATRIYDRYSYDAEKRMAMETWERRLRAILANEPRGSAVLPFARG